MVVTFWPTDDSENQVEASTMVTISETVDLEGVLMRPK